MSAPTPSLRRPDRRPRSYRFAAGDDVPRIVDEVDGGARVEVSHRRAPGAAAQLAHTSTLPSNLRWARQNDRSLLIADVAPGARANTSAVVAALQRARDAAPAGARVATPFDVAELQASLLHAGLTPDVLLPLTAALELRFPVEGVVRAVLIEGTATEWMLQCNVLKRVAPDDAVIADQALRHNAIARFARLALAGGTVVAQAGVERAAGAPEFLIRSARAVAALAHHATFALAALHENPEVRATYARLIPVPDPLPGENR